MRWLALLIGPLCILGFAVGVVGLGAWFLLAAIAPGAALLGLVQTEPALLVLAAPLLTLFGAHALYDLWPGLRPARLMLIIVWLAHFLLAAGPGCRLMWLIFGWVVGSFLDHYGGGSPLPWPVASPWGGLWGDIGIFLVLAWSWPRIQLRTLRARLGGSHGPDFPSSHGRPLR